MKKAAVIFANGCDEGEALTIVDIFRRAELKCDIVGLSSDEITGAHDITIKADSILSDQLSEYDMVILPGGYEGADNMMNNTLLLDQLKKMSDAGKWIAAICAAPLVLHKAGLLKDRTFTCYPTVADQIHEGTRTDDVVVRDHHIITSQAPATAYAFAYDLVDVMGNDSLTVKKGMAYFNAFDVKEEN